MTTALIAIGGAPIAVALVLYALAVASRALHEQRQWGRAVREVIRTDSRMLSDAFWLSLAHFQSVNELRKLGGRR